MPSNVIKFAPSELSNNSTKREQQLSFGFDQEKQQIDLAIVSMELVHGLDFYEIISQLKPKVVLDVRHSVRFDLPCVNRSVIFKKFDECGSFYSHISLKWHKFNKSDVMLGNIVFPQKLNHELFERTDIPLLMLVQKAFQANWLQTLIHRRFAENSNKKLKIKCFN